MPSDPTTSEGERLKHNHLTRDLKPIGACPACDAYRKRLLSGPKPRTYNPSSSDEASGA